MCKFHRTQLHAGADIVERTEELEEAVFSIGQSKGPCLGGDLIAIETALERPAVMVNYPGLKNAYIVRPNRCGLSLSQTLRLSTNDSREFLERLYAKTMPKGRGRG